MKKPAEPILRDLPEAERIQMEIRHGAQLKNLDKETLRWVKHIEKQWEKISPSKPKRKKAKP